MSEVLTAAEVGERALVGGFGGGADVFSEGGAESVINPDTIGAASGETEVSVTGELSAAVGWLACGACIGCPFFDQCIKPQAVAMKQESADQGELSNDVENTTDEELVANMADFMPKQSYLEELLAPDDIDEIRETGRGEVIMAGYQVAKNDAHIETVKSSAAPKYKKAVVRTSNRDEVVVEAEPKPETHQVIASTVVRDNFSEEANTIDQKMVSSYDELEDELAVDEASLIKFSPITEEERVVFVEKVTVPRPVSEDVKIPRVFSEISNEIEMRSGAVTKEADFIDGSGEFLVQAAEVPKCEEPEALDEVDVDVELADEVVGDKVAAVEKMGSNMPIVVKKSTTIKEEKLIDQDLPDVVDEIIVDEDVAMVELEPVLQSPTLTPQPEVLFEKSVEEKPFIVRQRQSVDEMIDAQPNMPALEKPTNQQTIYPLDKLSEVLGATVDRENEDAAVPVVARVPSFLSVVNKYSEEDAVPDESIDSETAELLIAVNNVVEVADAESFNQRKPEAVHEFLLEQNLETVLDNQLESEAVNKGYGANWLAELVGAVAVFAAIGRRPRRVELV